MRHTHERSQVIVEHVVGKRATVRIEQRVPTARDSIERDGIGEQHNTVVFASVGQQSRKVGARFWIERERGRGGGRGGRGGERGRCRPAVLGDGQMIVCVRV